MRRQVWCMDSQLPRHISYPHAYCFKLLQQSPESATSYPDTGQSIMVLAVTSSVTYELVITIITSCY